MPVYALLCKIRRPWSCAKDMGNVIIARETRVLRTKMMIHVLTEDTSLVMYRCLLSSVTVHPCVHRSYPSEQLFSLSLCLLRHVRREWALLSFHSVCLSVGHSATYSLPRLIDHNQIWSAGIYLSLDPCKPFWIPYLSYFGCQRENMQNFAYFQCVFLPLRTWRIVPYDLSVCLFLSLHWTSFVRTACDCTLLDSFSQCSMPAPRATCSAMLAFIFQQSNFSPRNLGIYWADFHAVFIKSWLFCRRLLIRRRSFSDRSKGIITAINFRVKIGETGLFTFIPCLGIQKRNRISQFWH